MSDLLNTDFTKMSILQKIAFFVLLPLILILGAFKLVSSASKFFEDKKRSEVDDKAKDLENKIEETKMQESKIEGSIESLEKEKQDAINKAESEDAISWHNSRKPDSKS